MLCDPKQCGLDKNVSIKWCNSKKGVNSIYPKDTIFTVIHVRAVVLAIRIFTS